MNSQVSNIVIMLVMMQASRRIDMENETNIFYIRAAYGTSFIIGFLIYQFARRKIISRNDITELKYKHKEQGTNKEVEIVTTVKEYDLQEIDAAIKSTFTNLAMMGFMHLYMKYTNPLFMQSISPIKSALEHNEVQIHLFSKAATGDLKRPFKTPSLMDSFMNAGAGATAQSADVDEELPKIEEIVEDKAAEGIKTE
ncbi:Snd3p NDAI_0A07870 [Naumovozyma dairenensis CBS 421]|uniref:Inorganic phosphate transport protein PHO88 n=1 Tax=Naumovozyma dairenensis (strain ATCC 10597 / BCRC 20456 / CBS 421 / NBRC 0211 / NRRL Y-12639) TaxID=1071378 RepID=G0W553_NAUDC|nr:hypothetical protein NDAI_0A07870 [Naumovozyma dairenensis CBS 421]CCD22941.1 hypothetical protein NDAI_0A07870 [Naumovozyma dairenensis CBS 421]